MRRLLTTWAGLAALVLVVLPSLLGRGCTARTPPPQASPEGGLTVSVYFPDTGQIRTLPLDEYLVGVVAAEMPPRFADEALRAQFVVARTYTVKHMRRFGGGGCSLEPRADVCASPGAGQAYTDFDALRQKLGYWAARRYWTRLQEQARATRGLLVTYRGQPIDAVYHATSGVMTEDAAAVWGRPVPYLRPVPDPYGKDAPNYVEEVAFATADLARALGIDPRRLAGGSDPPVVILGRTPGGRVAQVRVGGLTLAGTEFRTRLGLRSADFTVRTERGRVVITTRGYGHGVGLSQWGANGMARAGKTFREILAHYYPGTEVEPIFEG
ncbi:stage II sporulation protein D [Caldinitratiruptor microaerophilus]|uniref:Stage II sporulation protein D n=1 Tax=Caldinitratiruptor microaerophilus TaxID=671077 RepID=A0AA35GAX1_9FIRM|nr:stage II sporulation protein D [Caldinitratiruptor microaerophilus]BDG61759.1 stage II sporulation protein D [Caldinitratiruptor microaerophilus]